MARKSLDETSPFRQPAARDRMRDLWRAKVQTMVCPLCEVLPKQPCVHPDGAPREAVHQERVAAYEEHSGDRSGSRAWRQRRAAARSKSGA